MGKQTKKLPAWVTIEPTTGTGESGYDWELGWITSDGAVGYRLSSLRPVVSIEAARNDIRMIAVAHRLDVTEESVIE